MREPIHVIHESYGDAVARRESNKIWYAILGTLLVIYGLIGETSLLIKGDFENFLWGLPLLLIGFFLVWLWFRRQKYYRNYFRKRNNSPISRISYG